jgi:hypothetical protein
MNSLLSVESLDGLGDEEIEDDELYTWLDDVQEGTSKAPEDADFDVESEIDLSADGFYVVLAEVSPDDTRKSSKGKPKAEEIAESGGSDNDWPNW